jgi:hypothetical protein
LGNYWLEENLHTPNILNITAFTEKLHAKNKARTYGSIEQYLHIGQVI